MPIFPYLFDYMPCSKRFPVCGMGVRRDTKCSAGRGRLSFLVGCDAAGVELLRAPECVRGILVSSHPTGGRPAIGSETPILLGPSWKMHNSERQAGLRCDGRAMRRDGAMRRCCAVESVVRTAREQGGRRGKGSFGFQPDEPVADSGSSLDGSRGRTLANRGRAGAGEFKGYIIKG